MAQRHLPVPLIGYPLVMERAPHFPRFLKATTRHKRLPCVEQQFNLIA
jgi:hypothetical protein